MTALPGGRPGRGSCASDRLCPGSFVHRRSSPVDHLPGCDIGHPDDDDARIASLGLAAGTSPPRPR
eukprot:5822437-Prymnesium_polylepis.1